MLNGHFSNPGAKFSILKEAKKYRYGLSQIVGELYGNGMVWRDLVWDGVIWRDMVWFVCSFCCLFSLYKFNHP